ncbi:MAG: class I SAM-dependent methyltransferase [Candidatus Zixiibacteriota bacterium]
MSKYYAKNLSAARLKRCYDIAPPRIRQYLKSELNQIISYMGNDKTVLELGCGYGRIIREICPKSLFVTGIDNSISNLIMAKDYLAKYKNHSLAQMDAGQLGFSDNSFNIVLCIQNGISAFKINPEILVTEAIRLTTRKGIIVFSSYSERFWDERLHWFELQAREGLLGEIDYDQTGNGIITCKDGFKATTFGSKQFREITDRLNLKADIFEVNQSSVFCIIPVE